MKQGWRSKKLGDVCEVIAGQSPKGEYYNSDGVGLPFYQGKKEFTGKYIGLPKKWTSVTTKEALKDDVLMSVRAPVGPVNFSTQRICIGRGLAAIRTGSLINKEFLYNFLVNHENQIVGNTGAVFNSINQTQIKSIPIPVPPLEEQKQIVAKLDQCFEAIDKAKANAAKNLENAKELFQSKLNEIFSQKGEGWVEKKLGDAYDVRDGTHDSPKYQDNGFPLITSKNLKNGLITLDKIKYISEDDYLSINKRSKVDVGDILFAMIGTIGNPVVVRNEPDFSIKNVALFKVSKNNDSDFLRYYLEYSTKVMRDEAKGTTQKFVGLGYLRNFTISLPDLDTQKKVVCQLKRLNKQTQSLESKYQQELNSLEELKKSILQKAFEGEL